MRSFIVLTAALTGSLAACTSTEPSVQPRSAPATLAPQSGHDTPTAMPSLDPDAPESISALVQTLLLSPQVQGYLHPEVPERIPVLIGIDEPALEAGSIHVFGKPADIETTANAKASGRAFVEISKLRIRGTKATVEFSLEAEGVTGRGTFSFRDPDWTTNSVDLAEH